MSGSSIATHQFGRVSHFVLHCSRTTLYVGFFLCSQKKIYECSVPERSNSFFKIAFGTTLLLRFERRHSIYRLRMSPRKKMTQKQHPMKRRLSLRKKRMMTRKHQSLSQQLYQRMMLHRFVLLLHRDSRPR